MWKARFRHKMHVGYETHHHHYVRVWTSNLCSCGKGRIEYVQHLSCVKLALAATCQTLSLEKQNSEHHVVRTYIFKALIISTFSSVFFFN